MLPLCVEHVLVLGLNVVACCGAAHAVCWAQHGHNMHASWWSAVLVLYVCRQQDEHLEDIEAAVSRLGRVGLTIHEELTTQVGLAGYHIVQRNKACPAVESGISIRH